MEVADRVKHGFLKEQNAQILQRNLFAVATHDPLLRLPPLFVIVVKRIRHGEPRVLARQSSQKRVASSTLIRFVASNTSIRFSRSIAFAEAWGKRSSNGYASHIRRRRTIGSP